MKRFLSVILAVVMLASCFAVGASAFKTKYVAKNNLGGYVCTKETYKDWEHYSYVITSAYSSKGYLTKSTKENHRGEAETATFSYDSKGNLTKKKEIETKDGVRTTCTTTEYTYNSNGDLINLSLNYYDYTDKSRSLLTAVYTYDSKGNIKKWVQKNADYAEEDGEEINYSNFSKSCSYTYDSSGRPTSKIFKSGNWRAEDIYSYDSAGNLKKHEYKHKDDSYVSSFSYDSEGRLIKEKFVPKTYEFDAPHTDVYSYSSKGLLTKVTRKYPDGFSYDPITCKYDSDGNLTKKIFSNGDENPETTEQIFDSKGNLKKETTRSSGSFVSSKTRSYQKLNSSVCKTSDGIHLGKYKFRYDGKKKEPTVQIDKSPNETFYSDRYFKGVDYKVVYSNNVKPGKATAKIVFTDPTEHPVKIVFEILPSRVTGLKVEKTTKSSAALSWKKVSGADKYIVYKYIEKTAKYVKAATVKTNKATIKNLKAGTTYKFCVKAVAKGVSGASYSAKVTAKTKK